VSNGAGGAFESSLDVFDKSGARDTFIGHDERAMCAEQSIFVRQIRQRLKSLITSPAEKFVEIGVHSYSLIEVWM